MFIQCSDCHYKYLVNSADLKPDGRMVECANCGNQWFQETSNEEELLSQSVPSSKISKTNNQSNINLNATDDTESKNNIYLPSTIVNEQKVSIINSFLVIFILFILITSFWLLRLYGTNIFVIINFYLKEFFFNLKLIINDIAKIIYLILN